MPMENCRATTDTLEIRRYHGRQHQRRRGKTGVAFPAQYRDFLLLYNGGEPQPVVGLYHDDIN